MTVMNHVLKNLYRDSVALMRLSRGMEGLDNVEQATAIMGTDNNKDLLDQAGLLADTGKSAAPNDLIVAFNLTPPGVEEAVMASVQVRLTAARQSTGGGTDYRPRSGSPARKSIHSRSRRSYESTAGHRLQQASVRFPWRPIHSCLG